MKYTNDNIRSLQKEYREKIQELSGEYFDKVLNEFLNEEMIVKEDIIYIDPKTNIKYEFKYEDIEIQFDLIENINKSNPHKFDFVSCNEDSEGYVEDVVIGRLIEYKEGN